MSLEIREIIAPGNENSFSVGQTWQDARLADLAPVHRALLEDEAAVTAALATVKASGQPQLSPVWFSQDGEHILLNSARGRVKDRRLRARPTATLLVVNPKNPYHYLTIDAVVEDIIDEDDPERGHLATENADAHAEKYLHTSPYPLRDPKGEVRVMYALRPTRILTFGPVEG